MPDTTPCELFDMPAMEAMRGIIWHTAVLWGPAW